MGNLTLSFCLYFFLPLCSSCFFFFVTLFYLSYNHCISRSLLLKHSVSLITVSLPPSLALFLFSLTQILFVLSFFLYLFLSLIFSTSLFLSLCSFSLYLSTSLSQVRCSHLWVLLRKIYIPSKVSVDFTEELKQTS